MWCESAYGIYNKGVGGRGGGITLGEQVGNFLI